MSDVLLPPAAVELEERLVASVIEMPHLFPQVPVTLKPEAFFSPKPRTVWAGILRCAEAGRPITDVDVFGAIRDTMGAERWAKEGQAVEAYLRSLYSVATSAMVAKDAERILGRAARRRMIAVAKQIAAEGMADQTDDETFLHDAQGLVLGAAQEGSTRTDDTCERLSDAIRGVFSRIHEDAAAGRRGGIRSGLSWLDAMTLGWRPGKVVIVGARPGMGKSAIMNTFAIEGAFDMDADEAVAALVFSAEMPRSEVAIRALSSEARYDGRKIQQARIQTSDWGDLTNAASALSQADVWIDDKPRPTLEHIRSRIRRLNHKLASERRTHEVEREGQKVEVVKRLRVQLVIVDYLQIMGTRKDKGRSREQEITELADGLKALAKEENCTVIALAQLNRDLEKRPDKRPQISDLRESGGIEQCADTILLLYRDEYYNKDSQARGLCEINVAKMRGGKTGRAIVRFEAEHTRFLDLTPEEKPWALEACGFTKSETDSASSD
jgi:replicative DNA helicase